MSTIVIEEYSAGRSRGAGIFLFLCLFFQMNVPAFAQDDDQGLEDALNAINGSLNQIINVTTLFTSQDSLSSGYLKFKSSADDEPDTDATLIRVPGKVYLEDDRKQPIRAFVRGQLSSMRAHAPVGREDTSPGREDFVAFDVYTAEGGFGVDFAPIEGLVIGPEGSIAYSHVDNRYDYNNEVSQSIAPLIDGEVFNWHLDLLTYIPRVKVAYTLPFEPEITFLSRYSYLYNNSFHSSSGLVDIDSDTSLFQNGVSAYVPLGVSAFDSPLGLRPLFYRSDIHGSARRGLGFDHFYEAGLNLAFTTERSLGVLSEVTLGGSYFWGDEFEGLRVGLGFDL